MTRRTAWIVVTAVIGVAIVAGVVWFLLQSHGTQSHGTGPRASGGDIEKVQDLTAPEMKAHAQQSLEELLTACTAPAAETPASCGIEIPWAADFASVTGFGYRIEQEPVLTLTPPTFRADDGILVATVTGVGLDGTAKTLTYRTENWMLRGDVAVKRGGVVLNAW